jgi:hypothetical protein
MPILPAFPPSSSVPSFKTIWQHNVAQSDLPFQTKGILLIVATEWMGADGGSCFPTEQQIMERAGVSRPTLTKHLRIAVDGGYIERWRWGHGNKNRRYNYQATLPGQPVSEIEMGNDLSYPAGEMGNIFSDHEPCPIINQNQERAAPQPEPPPPPKPQPKPDRPLPPSDRERKERTAAPDAIPDGWIETAQSMRPDLTTDQINRSAGRFIDFHRGKGSQFKEWLPIWRIWISKERPDSPRTATQRPQSPQPERRYQTPAQEAALQEANRQAMEASEARRIAMLIRCGIDPATGLRIAQPTPPATPAARDTDRDRIEAGVEEKRRERIASLERRVAERNA